MFSNSIHHKNLKNQYLAYSINQNASKNNIQLQRNPYTNTYIPISNFMNNRSPDNEALLPHRTVLEP
jgi:hypothetical protein